MAIGTVFGTLRKVGNFPEEIRLDHGRSPDSAVVLAEHDPEFLPVLRIVLGTIRDLGRLVQL
jgi:hypothetical protein